MLTAVIVCEDPNKCVRNLPPAYIPKAALLHLNAQGRRMNCFERVIFRSTYLVGNLWLSEQAADAAEQSTRIWHVVLPRNPERVENPQLPFEQTWSSVQEWGELDDRPAENASSFS